MTELHQMGVVDVADAVAHGSVTAETVARASLDRLEQLGSRFAAVVRIEREPALEAARAIDLDRLRGETLGTLAGVPLAHKDLIYRANRPCSGGSKVRKNFLPKITSTALSRLDKAGALDLGTLHMAEFALSPTGYNVHYGHGRNPWNTEYCSGGSSSGSGVAVAARLVSASLGSDTGGSIRHPAAMCGVTGLKPTHGLVSLSGTMPLAPSLDTIGPIARSAQDVARLLTVIAGPDTLDGATVHGHVQNYEQALNGNCQDLTIAVPETYYRENADTEILGLLDQSLEVLKSSGAKIIRTTVPDMGLINAMMQLIMGAEAATLHLKWLAERPRDYGDQVRSRIMPGFAYPATRYIEAMMMRGKIIQEWLDTVMQDADMAHLPTLATPVPSIAQTLEGSEEERAAILGRVTHCTRGINYLGLPSIAIPCGFSASTMPVSFQLVGRPFSENILLRVADAYQRNTEFHTIMPPECDFTNHSSFHRQ